jgi:plastocyanin domain-containing protein
MMNHSTIFASVATVGVVLGISTGGAVAQLPHEGSHPTEQTAEFQRIEQPLWVKGVVTASGLGLIGLELWWFLFSKSKPRQPITESGVQEITITVDGGYEPSQVVVQAGQRVRLNFDRKDPNHCLEEVRLPDFRIAQELPLHQITPVEFTPEKPGRYEFTCGMNMFRGMVEVKAAKREQATVSVNSPAGLT